SWLISENSGRGFRLGILGWEKLPSWNGCIERDRLTAEGACATAVPNRGGCLLAASSYQLAADSPCFSGNLDHLLPNHLRLTAAQFQANRLFARIFLHQFGETVR